MTNAWLEELVERIHAVDAAFAAMRAHYAIDDLARRPSKRAWSAFDCAEHLHLTTRQYRLPMAKAVAANCHRLRSAGFEAHVSLVGRITMWGMAPKRKWRFPAPPSLHPKVAAGAQAIDALAQEHAAFVELMHAADALDLNAIRFPDPVLPMFPINLTDGFLLIAVHAERHCAQAKRAIETAIANETATA